MSVRPAQLERRLGACAYSRCVWYRLASMVFMVVAMVCFVVYYFHPLDLAVPRAFPWPWPISTGIAVVLGLPAGYVMLRGINDAGEETLVPKKEHGMYGGIYLQIRHPQAWEAIFWFVLAFALNSPFLVILSFIGLLLEYWMVAAEEKDLVIRFGSAYQEYRRTTGAFWPRRAIRMQRSLLTLRRPGS